MGPRTTLSACAYPENNKHTLHYMENFISHISQYSGVSNTPLFPAWYCVLLRAQSRVENTSGWEADVRRLYSAGSCVHHGYGLPAEG